MQEVAAPRANSELLIHTQRYLTYRHKGLSPSPDLEAAWMAFYNLYSHKIRTYASAGGTAEDDLADCVQEVWRELLVRLPTFHYDASRGQFDTWLYSIVRSKTANHRRSRKRRLLQGDSDTLQTVPDHHPSPGLAFEDKEMAILAWEQLRKRLSECNFQVLRMRLVEQRPVAEVAEKLGLSNQQVWYRYHRARRELEEIGCDFARCQRLPRPISDALHEKKEKE